jgi:glycosyltransferase involved in cell wall biosynthesis
MRLGVFQDALNRVVEVDTLVLPLSGPPPDEQFTDSFGKPAMTIPIAGHADTLFSLLMQIADPAERLTQFRKYGRGSRHAALSAAVLTDIRQRLNGRNYHLAHVARLYLAEAIEGVEATRRTIDLDEDDAWAWRRLAATQSAHEAEWSVAESEAEDQLLARRGGTFDTRFVSGPADAATLAGRYPDLLFESVPNAISFPAQPERRDDGNTILFVGAFGYRPNVEGVLWFAREVWPELRASLATPARLCLVGSDPPEEIRALGAAGINIEVVGRVDDPSRAYAEATLAIAPLHTGAGTRLKIIEAAAYRVPVVTTALAARGLAFIDGDSAWLADAPGDFAASVLAAFADPAGRDRRADLAHARAHAIHDRAQVVERLAQRFADMLQSHHAAQGTR